VWCSGVEVRYLLEKLAKGGWGGGFVVVRGAEVGVGAKDLLLGHEVALLLSECAEEPMLCCWVLMVEVV
jgi:hypothetical protein